MSSAPDVGSQAWQAIERIDELSGYLERVAAAPALRAFAERTLSILALQPGEWVLEVGCGTGVFLPLLAEAVGSAGQVIGLDRATAFVDQARERVRRLDIVRVDEGDAYALPYADATFDAAHCERVLMHLEDPTAVLHEMRRVVRPGGVSSRRSQTGRAWPSIVMTKPQCSY